MARWSEFQAARPELATAGRDLLYQFGVGLAFLATTRGDGGPRVHPMCPIVHEDGLYALLVPSPKREDLLRDGRYAMHSFPADDNEDAFYLTGRATFVGDTDIRNGVVATFLRERPGLAVGAGDLDDQLLFELDVATCLLTRTTGHGDPDPKHAVWHEPG